MEIFHLDENCFLTKKMMIFIQFHMLKYQIHKLLFQLILYLSVPHLVELLRTQKPIVFLHQNIQKQKQQQKKHHHRS